MQTFNLDQLDLRTLRLILILSETHSLAKTSGSMHLSVSQASRLLAEARRIFGAELFTRHGAIMVPTPELAELLPRVRAVFSSIDQLFSPETGADLFESSQIIRIGCVDNVSAIFLVPILGEIHRRAPNLRLEVMPLGNHSLHDLRAGDLDLMIACDPFLHLEEVEHARLLLSAPMNVVVRRNHPLALEAQSSGRLSVTSLNRYPMISPTVSQPSGLTAAILPLNQTISPRLLQTPHFLANALALLETDAYMVVPAPLFDLLTQHLPLEQLHVEDLVMPIWIPSLIWHNRTDTDPLRQWLRALILSGTRERWRQYIPDDFNDALDSARRAETCSMNPEY